MTLSLDVNHPFCFKKDQFQLTFHFILNFKIVQKD